MNIKADEISKIIKNQLGDYSLDVDVAEVAQVDAALCGAFERAGGGDTQRIEVVVVRDRNASRA